MSESSQDNYILGEFVRIISNFGIISKSIDETGKLRTQAQACGCSGYIRDALKEYSEFLSGLASINGSGMDMQTLLGIHKVCSYSAPHVMKNGLGYRFAPEGNMCYITKEDNATKVNPPLENAIVGLEQMKPENYRDIINALQHYSSMCKNCTFNKYHDVSTNLTGGAK